MSHWSETVVQELRGLQEQGATGTYYIVSTDNKQVRIGIVDGEVSVLSVRTATLTSAIDTIAGLKIARTRFANDGLAVTSGIGDISLDTDTICQELLQRVGHRPSLAKPSQFPTQPGANGVSLSKAQDQAIRNILIEYMGPVGEIVYDEHRHTAKSVDLLLTNLAEEIPDTHNAAQFMIRASRHAKVTS